jgi:nucleoid DNA-binding protein
VSTNDDDDDEETFNPNLVSLSVFGEFETREIAKKGFLIKSMPPILVCAHKLPQFSPEVVSSLFPKGS